MVTAIMKGFMYLCFIVIKGLGNLVTLPIQWLLVSLFPDFADFTSSLLTFFDNQFFPFLGWVKCSFLGITLIPVSVWTFTITTLFTLGMFAPVFRSLRLLYGIWQVWRGTQKG